MAILITFHSLEGKAAAEPQDPKVNRELGKNEAREAASRNVRLNGAPVLKDAPNGVLDIEGTRPPPLEIYAYKSHFQPYRAWFGIFATSVFLVFSGWFVFAGGFDAGDFVSCYIAVSLHCSCFM